MEHDQSTVGPASMAEIAAAIPPVLDRTPADRFSFRPGRSGEEPLVLGMLDEAVAWLNRRGVTDQWGTQPFSAVPRRVEVAHEWLDSGGTVIAGHRAGPAGVLVLGSAPDYVPPTDCREVYVVLLVAGRSPEARGVGTPLLEIGRQVTTAVGAQRLRVDCFAGGDQALVRFYEGSGFTRTDTFRVGNWPGQVLEWRTRT